MEVVPVTESQVREIFTNSPYTQHIHSCDCTGTACIVIGAQLRWLYVGPGAGGTACLTREAEAGDEAGG